MTAKPQLRLKRDALRAPIDLKRSRSGDAGIALRSMASRRRRAVHGHSRAAGEETRRHAE